MKPAPHQLPRSKTTARLSAIGRRGAEIANRNKMLATEGIDRPKPSMPVVKWLLRPDPFEDKP